MTSAVLAVDARCPLCDVALLSPGPGGRLSLDDLHGVPLSASRGQAEGYLLCESCALLAGLPGDTTPE